MNLIEAHAKKILADYGIPVPKNGGIITRASQTAAALKKIGRGPWVVKAQAQTGGRGKAGGIKAAKSAAQAKNLVSEILGMRLVTAQTGPEGLSVKSVLIEQALSPARELYLSVALDRKNACPVLIASAEGGMDIETLAESSPEKILKVPVSPILGLEPFQARELLFDLKLNDPDPIRMLSRSRFLQDCVRAFLASDASLLEINPLALSAKGDLLALDAKIILDDSALYRHPDYADFAAASELSPQERRAKKVGISYIQLKGNIGCMVNGAGLAMATMDLIKQHGGEPANFLDVGGGASVEQVKSAFEMILSDKNVKTIFVNIFGGIMRCDVIAEGIVAAVKKMKLTVPLVVRLEGNRLAEGKKILEASGLNIESISELSAAAKKAVELAA